MQKPNYYFRVVSTTLVVIAAAGAVLAMLQLLAAKPALADAGWPATIETVQSISSDGNIYFEGTGPPDGAVDLFEVKDEGDNKVGSSSTSDCYYLGTPMYFQYCWSVSLTGVADGTHTYYAVGYEDGNVSDPSDPSNAVTVVVDRSIPPTVSPVGRDGETLTAPIRMLTVDFSKTMDPNTLTTSTFTVVKDGSTTPVDGGKVSWSISGKEYRSAYLTFPSYLEGGTKYTATIKGGPEGVKDEFGVPLAEDYVWSFTTATWPTVESVSPSNGAEQVPTNTNVTATFSKDMKWFWLKWPVTNCTGCIQLFTLVKEGSTTPVDATVIYDDATKRATMDPSANLQENTKYTAKVKGSPDGVEDVWSNPLAADKGWSFTTAEVTQPEDVTPPETSIDSGPSGPTNDTTPTFTFSGSDNVTSSTNLNYQYQLDSGGWSTPPSTSITANLTGLSEGAHLFEVRAVDEASNVDASPAKQNFTVDTTSPKVTTTTVPAAGATGVGRSANVTAPFSEAPDPSTVTQDTLKDNFMLGKGKLSSSQLSSTTRIASSLSYDPTALKATLDPYGTTTTRLARCQWYTAKVTTEVKDLAGNQLDQDGTLSGLQPKLWYFKTSGC